MKNFEFLQPETIEDAILLSLKYGKEASFMAGGTDFLVDLRHNKKTPNYIINLKKINGLNQIMFDQKKGLNIGALVTLSEIESNPIIKSQFDLLKQAAHSVGSLQIRNQATIGGNICNGSPSADTAPSLIALGSKVKIVGLKKEHILLLEDFFISPGIVDLKEGEILTEFIVPVINSPKKGIFVKHAFRKALELSLVSVAILVIFDEKKEICQDVRIALGAVAPTPMRARKAEKILRNNKIKEVSFDLIAKTAAAESRPISDIRATAEYRREMIYQIIVTAFNNIKKSL
jgi:CO/xanthine dehydrogenase FAD-binding subunit